MHFTILGDWNSILHVNKCLAQSAPKMAKKMINTKILKKKCQARLQEVGVKSPPTISKLLSPLPIFAPPLFPSTLGSFPSPRKKTLPRLWPVLQVSRFLNFYLSNTWCIQVNSAFLISNFDKVNIILLFSNLPNLFFMLL